MLNIIIKKYVSIYFVGNLPESFFESITPQFEIKLHKRINYSKERERKKKLLLKINEITGQKHEITVSNTLPLKKSNFQR